MKNFKIIFLIIISMMILSLIACSTGADKPKNQDNSNKSAQQADDKGEQQENPDDETAPEEVKLLPNVPENLNLDGFKFRLLYNFKKDFSGWGVIGIEAAEETGDVINDAAYRRNTYVTDKYNFELAGIPVSDTVLNTAYVKKIIQSGSDDFDALIIRQMFTPPLITSNSFVDLNTISTLDFDKPWWDRGIMNQMSINGKQFAAFGDLIVGANDALRILMFNKKLHKDAQLEDLYTLVKEGKWTIDKFYDMSKDVSADLNGDGIMNTYDLYGLLLQRGGVACFMFGAGESVISKDENDTPVLTMGSERSIIVLQKIWDVMNTPNIVLFDADFSGADPWQYLQIAFENNQGLFFGEVLNLVERMRATETEFGVLPFPKYNDAQENYYAFADSNCMNHMFVPVTNQNLEKTGQVLEILNAESYYTVRPAYYDKSLNGKFMRDEESSEMLDIIMSNKVISLDEFYGWGMFGAVQNALTSKSADFVSVIEKNTAKTEKNIQKTINAIDN